MDYRPQVWQEYTSDYQEVAPDLRLRPYIQSYWFSYTDSSSPPSRIIPDLCSDVIVQLSTELDVLQIKVSGPNTSFFYSYSDQPIVYFGIRYYLGGMYPFFNQSFKGLKDQLTELALLEKRMAVDLTDNLSGKTSLSEVIKGADLYFLERLNRLSPRKISIPIQMFIENHGHLISYAEGTANRSLSERSLQRLFREETGLSPYEAFDVLRFQKVYQELISKPNISHLDLVEKYGFFDQAHYSRKMKKMTGLTPQAIRQHVGILQDKH
ncbi:helix-turn-helix domain-containing protein [Enterococcus caccae]|uniref:HTH araC/xylS-type domain-containing protein n=1 Tax=Enterococcus caccae ATCC BAA-1240 TaxID=1158612 RepID=R3X0A2_9ENTE|nr:helix-turn-helix domain-containing protein [Enterococcus caccae]EOL47450.1 hypothetical protein UC7_01110 [Enterococcus caccae ATCC BAA-1240]EOT65657.1 hypothetical protein I580_01414 [Enterococcus caccae ATCC BAA-1240]OJG23793.1 hypothetical protein RU98_GL001805 [Enterococcus caccae]